MKHKDVKKMPVGVKMLAVVGAVGLLAGCAAGGETSEPQADMPIVKGGDAVIAVSSDAENPLDPILSTGQVGRTFMDPICERLYEEQSDGSAVPMLATEMPTVSEDNMTLTVPLREGVVFNDGTPFNAEAVKYNLDRAAQDPLSVHVLAKQYIQAVDVVDEYTVEITLSEPFSPIMAELTSFTGMIVSPTQLEAEGAISEGGPLCVGPFEYTSRVPGAEVVITKSDLYYDKDLVNLDSVTFKIITDINARSTSIEAGDVQFGNVLKAFYARMKDSTAVHAEVSPRSGANGFSFNVGNVAGVTEPYGVADNIMAQHPELREAFTLAIDREALAQVALAGNAPAGCSPMFAASEYAFEIECTPFDLEKAKKLVEESGVPTPIRLKTLVAPYEISTTTAQIMQEMVKEAGFDLELVPQEALSVFDALQSGDFELVPMSHSPLDPDPANMVVFDTGNVYNWPGYSDPEVDALLKTGRETFDRDERTAAYQEATEIFNKSHSYVYLGGMVSYWATSQNFTAVGGVTLMGTMYLKESGFTELP